MMPTAAELLKAAEALETPGTHLSGRVKAATKVAQWLREMAAK